LKARCFSAKFNGMIGTDIIEIERVRKSAENESFSAGAFTAAEREYYESHGKRAETLAGMFCAKEAVAKALGCGFRGFRPCHVEIMHDSLGAPRARLIGKAAELFPNAQIEISISHCAEYATAVAIVNASKV